MRVELVRAWPRRSDSVVVELREGASVGEALQSAGWALEAPFAGLAIHGVAATLASPLRAGDRVELLRPLQLDPKQARRLRAERAKRV